MSSDTLSVVVACSGEVVSKQAEQHVRCLEFSEKLPWRIQMLYA
jgi:hypothetical protein